MPSLRHFPMRNLQKVDELAIQACKLEDWSRNHGEHFPGGPASLAGRSSPSPKHDEGEAHQRHHHSLHIIGKKERPLLKYLHVSSETQAAGILWSKRDATMQEHRLIILHFFQESIQKLAHICYEMSDINLSKRIKINFRWKLTCSLTEIAGGTATSGSWKNLLARASARRLLCIPANDTCY